MQHKASSYSSCRALLMSIFMLSAFCCTTSAFAVDIPDAGQMINNFARSVPQLMKLITAVAYVLGFFFVVKAVLLLKQFGDMRTMMMSQHSVKGPLVYFFIGSMLIYLPETVSVGMSSFWDNPNPYMYETQTDQWNQLIGVLFTIVQLFGTIAFIRGLVMLSTLGAGQGQPGTLGRGMTHIIGGIFCINIYEFIKMVFATLGVTGVPGF